MSKEQFINLNLNFLISEKSLSLKVNILYGKSNNNAIVNFTARSPIASEIQGTSVPKKRYREKYKSINY